MIYRITALDFCDSYQYFYLNWRYVSDTGVETDAREFIRGSLPIGEDTQLSGDLCQSTEISVAIFRIDGDIRYVQNSTIGIRAG